MVLEECWYYAKDRKGTWRERLGAVFADGTVKLGHELAQRSWLETKQKRRKSRARVKTPGVADLADFGIAAPFK